MAPIILRQRVGRWITVVRVLPFNLGYLVRLETQAGGFLGPKSLSIFGQRVASKIAWWYAPTMEDAHIRAFDERKAWSD